MLHRLLQLDFSRPTLQEVLQLAAAEIASASAFTTVAIQRYEPVRQVILIEGQVGIPMPQGISTWELPPEATDFPRVRQHLQPIIKICANHDQKVAKHPYLLNWLLGQQPIGTWITLPLLVGAEVMGILSLAHPQVFLVSQEQLTHLTSVANYLGLLIQNKLLQEKLRQSQERHCLLQKMNPGIIYEWDPQSDFVWREKGLFELLGFREEEADARGSWWLERIHPEDIPAAKAKLEQLFSGKQDQFQCEYRVRHRNGSYCWVLDKGIALRNKKGQVVRIVGNTKNIEEIKSTEQALQHQLQQARLLAEISQHIRESLDLEQILQTTVAEVRSLLQTDRVIIFQFRADWSGEVVMESVVDPWQPILGSSICDSCFAQPQTSIVAAYQQGRIRAIEDVKTADLDPCYVQLLEDYQVRANLVVPILHKGSLWGLLIAHHCSGPRQWQDHEAELLKHLADQVAIAIHQSQLYQQVCQLNADLEDMVDERTQQLRQALKFESLLKHIIEKVRDSLDEDYILQTVVEELRRQLNVIAVSTALYDYKTLSSTVNHEYINTNTVDACHSAFCLSVLPVLGKVTPFADFADLYHQLLQGQPIQFCFQPSSSADGSSAELKESFTVLACPMLSDDQVLGDLWLYDTHTQVFSQAEVQIIQQIAAQCAIALRQSRLYKASLTQVQELERLNQLKDDFLSTVSHELRSPMASIKMAAKMLSLVLEKIDFPSENKAAIQRYLSILNQECTRETNLINDLLELSRLEANAGPVEWSTLDLRAWLTQQLEPFRERAAAHTQSLTLLLPEHLPPVITAPSYLERLLGELLTNACKYTPAGERITVSVTFFKETWQLQVANTGVVIPPEELARVFDKFYRVPKNDPWKHGGTGLGLALSQKVAKRLQGSLKAESEQNETRFILELPLTPTQHSA
ncbi:MAG: GAF domain-containing protein [Cyanobacteriota bacterium]